jgi:hypothetical protein
MERLGGRRTRTSQRCDKQFEIGREAGWNESIMTVGLDLTAKTEVHTLTVLEEAAGMEGEGRRGKLSLC